MVEFAMIDQTEHCSRNKFHLIKLLLSVCEFVIVQGCLSQDKLHSLVLEGAPQCYVRPLFGQVTQTYPAGD